MGSISHDQHNQAAQFAVIMVPLPAQGHLNQLLQLSCLITSYGGLSVHYVGSAVHNRQARTRINGLRREAVAEIHFHDIPTPPFLSPPPNPNSPHNFPSHLQPAWEAMRNLREPVAAYLRQMAGKFKRLAVVHDRIMAAVVQDVASIDNAESYAINCFSAISTVSFTCEFAQGKPFPVEHPKELPSFDGCLTEQIIRLVGLNRELMSHREGDIYYTCRLIEAPYLEALEREEKKKCWAIAPLLPEPDAPSQNHQHECLEWLDRQEPRSVIYVSFGTTVSLSDEQINELAHGLQHSKVKFLWVLRDADRGDVFEGEVRRVELPEGFGERVGGEGIVVREWAPQPQILAHPSIGGFMSHCGWNSCVESITMGVAIAAWPMHSDQPRNAALITDVLRTGVVVREWKKRLEVVRALSVVSVVRRLMASEEGEDIRRRAEELGAALRQAAQPGGASRVELDSFIAHITRV